MTKIRAKKHKKNKADNASANRPGGMLNVDQALSQAVNLHTSGRLQDAQVVYEKVLAAQPKHPIALHLLGVVMHQKGDNTRAAQLIEKAVRFQPTYTDAHNNLGLVYDRLGKLDKAIRSFQKAIKQRPEFPDAHFNLANVYKKGEHFPKAISAYKSVIRLVPGHSDAYNNLGLTHQAQGNISKAIECFQKAIAINQNDPKLHNNLGNAQKIHGDLDSALLSLKQAVKLQDNYVEAHNNLGTVLGNLERFEEAIPHYRKALQHAPKFTEAHFNLGKALKDTGQLDEAVECYLTAISLKPDFTDALTNLGNAYCLLTQHHKAISAYKKSLEINPNSAIAFNNLGLVYFDLKRFEEAARCFRSAIDINPAYPEAHTHLMEMLERQNLTEQLRDAYADAQRACPDHPHIALGQAWLLKRERDYATARSVLEQAIPKTTDPQIRITQTFLLGNICDRLKDEDTAFSCFVQGNVLKQAERPDWRAAAERYTGAMDQQATCFTKDWITSWSEIEYDAERPDPVFLVGFPRSGTTLLNTILHSHSAIEVVEEQPVLGAVREALLDMPGSFPENLATLTSQDIADLRKIYFSSLDTHLESDHPPSVIVDKHPLNSTHAGLIHRLFPNAKILFAQRHPCDCVLSCFMQSFGQNDAVSNFLDLNLSARLYDKTLNLWNQYTSLLPIQTHTLVYEDLVVSFEDTARVMLDFLELEWEDSLRDYAKTAHNRGKIYTPSYNQVTQPLYTRASGRWERYRSHLEDVLPMLLPWAERMGYAT